MKVVAEWFPEKERALAAGLFNSGSAVGAILAPPDRGVTLILHFGWQSAFAVVGLAGLVWLVFWWPMYHTPKAAPGALAEKRCWFPVREPAAHALRLGVHLLQDLHGSGLVLLHFLVPGIPEARARLRPRARSGVFVDSVRGGRVRQYSAAAGCRGVSCAADGRVTLARKTSVTFFAVADDVGDSGGAGAGSVDVDRARVHRHARLHRLPGQHAVLPADVFPKHAVASVYGLASMGSGFGGMLFTLITGWVVDHYVHPGVHRVRNPAADLRIDSVDPGRAPAPRYCLMIVPSRRRISPQPPFNCWCPPRSP